jgi:WS/DGAT/MGAT family acyltransferase
VGGTLGGFGAGLALGAVNQLLGQGSRRDAVDLGLGLAGDLGTALAGVTLDVHGAEHLVSHRPAVFLFNHQSQLDVIVLAKLLRGGFTAVAKKEVASIPGFGAAFRLADVAFVDRGNTTAAKAALEPAVQRLREGISLVIAPEGTRSVTPALGPFKKGAFHVAMQAGVPVVPIVIHNAGELMWRGASTIREGTVQVTVLPPVSTDGWTTDDLDAHVAAVRAGYLDALDQGDHPAARGPVEVTTGPTGPVAVPLAWESSAEMAADAAAVWRSGSARSTLTLLEQLDPAPDPGRLAAAHEWASRMVPRMRQVVSEPALGAGPPVWAGVADLDLAHHLTRISLPAPGSQRQLLDAVAEFAAAPLDRSRPLWGALLVDGLADGTAGYAVKIHHSVTDGVGAVRLMGLLHSRTAEHDPERPEPPVPPVVTAPSAAQALARLGSEALGDPVGTVSGLVRSAGRLLAPPADPARRRAPLLAGRGGVRRAEVLEVPHADLRAGAAAAGGSPTDGFLAAVLGALRSYHRHFGVDVDDTTVALGLPVGLGAQDGADGRLAGAVVRAPLTVADPAQRVRAVRELVLSTGPAGPLGAGADVQVASVPGIGHPVWFAGSRVTRLFPLGPLAGCAAAVTMVAHDGTACVGVVLDDAAVTEPDVLLDALRAGLAEVLELG